MRRGRCTSAVAVCAGGLPCPRFPRVRGPGVSGLPASPGVAALSVTVPVNVAVACMGGDSAGPSRGSVIRSVSLGWAPPPGHSGPGSLAGAGVGEQPSPPGVLLGGLAVCHDDHSPAPLLEPPGDPLWLPTEFSEVKCSFWGPRRFLPVSRVPALCLAVCQNCRVSVSGVCGPLDVRSGLAGPGRDAPGAPPSRDCGAGPGPETLLITL